MSYDPNDPQVQPRRAPIKDRVVVRDDSKVSAAAMLGSLIAVMLIGGGVLYAFSGGRDSTTSINSPAFPDGTTGQGGIRPPQPQHDTGQR